MKNIIRLKIDKMSEAMKVVRDATDFNIYRYTDMNLEFSRISHNISMIVYINIRSHYNNEND